MLHMLHIGARLQQKTARYIETLDEATMSEITARVVSAINPEPEPP